MPNNLQSFWNQPSSKVQSGDYQMALFQPVYLSHMNFPRPEWHWHTPQFLSHLGEGDSWLQHLPKPLQLGSPNRRHTPAFDVRETQTHYFLEGELPGTRSRNDVKMEWTGKRTLLVEATIPDIDLEQEWGIDLSSPTPPEHSESYGGNADEVDDDMTLHRCTTRGEDEDSTLPPNEEKKPQHASHAEKPKTTRSNSSGSQGEAFATRSQLQDTRRASLGAEFKRRLSWKPTRRASQPKPALRMWTNERHAGPFKRVFNFPEDVEHDSLVAKLDQGLLKVLVFKHEPMKPKLVPINVMGSYFAD